MTMNRVIHGAVRRDLARLSDALAEPGATTGGRARGLDTAFNNLHRELVRHHEGEDTHVWPTLERLGVDTTLLTAMVDEHEAMATALAQAKEAMAAYVRTPSHPTADVAGAAVRHAMEVTDAHLRHEEEELEPHIIEHQETPEWKAVERQFRRGPLGETGWFLAWIQDGMGGAERSYLRSAIPPPVLFLLSRLAGRGYQRTVAPVWR